MHIAARILIPNLNPSILDQITEAQVVEWMAAKLDQIRNESGLPIHNFDVEVWRREYTEYKYDASWSLHAGPCCALTHKTIASAVEEARQELLGNPKEKADEARRKAKALLEEAETMEKLAAA